MTGWRKRKIADAIDQYAKDGNGKNLKERVAKALTLPLRPIAEVEIAGLTSSVGHLSAIVDEQRAILVEVEQVCGVDGHGAPLEDGESELIDRVRAHLATIAPPRREPLTDEQIDEIWNRYCDEMGEASINDAYDIARAIEAAHGIKGDA